jgi:hypothetical protein
MFVSSEGEAARVLISQAGPKLTFIH